MSWKEWPYWLKGAVLADGIFIILFLFAYFIIDKIFPSGGHPPAGLSTLIALPGIILMVFLDISDDLIALFIAIPFSLIFYFLLGALIGWIVGKIRHKQ